MRFFRFLTRTALALTATALLHPFALAQDGALESEAAAPSDESVQAIEAERAAAMAALQNRVVPGSVEQQLNAYQVCLDAHRSEPNETTNVDPRETCRGEQAALEQRLPASMTDAPDQEALPETLEEPVPVDLSASQVADPPVQE
jgi:hypothetical protein